MRKRLACVGLLVVSIVVSGMALPWSAPANAEDVSDPTYAPAPLISPAALPADPEAASAIRALEDEAVAMTVSQHGLTSSDHDAVATWGRVDALANLWGLVVQAMRTTPAGRTAEQRHAVAWMSSMLRSQAQGVAEHTGEQYARWAGLSLASYWAKVNTDASREELTSFFTTTAQPYGAASLEHTGYCNYRSPDPYADEYTGYRTQTCYTPCTSWTCQPPRPSFDQFSRWGSAVATAHLKDPSLMYDAAAVAQATVSTNAAMGTATTAAAAAALATLFVDMAGTMAAVQVTPGLVLASTLTGATTFSIVAAPVLLVIAAVVGVVMAAINLAEELDTPGRLAALLVDARTKSYDPSAALATDDGKASLFALFMQATGVPPRTDKGCDNTLIPVKLYGSATQDQAMVWDPQTGKPLTVMTYPCLNQPPVPETRREDPHFVVRDADTGAVTTTPTISTRLNGSDGKPAQTFSLRASGKWWVVRSSNEDTQALSVTYTGWDGQPRTASIVQDKDSDYSFRGLLPEGFGKILDPATCVWDQTCWSGRVLRFIGDDGRRYEALLEGPVVGTPRHTAKPTAGQRVLMDAGGFGPASARGVVYDWRFQEAGCAAPCSTWTRGAVVRHTWTQPGTYTAELRATYEPGWPPLTTTLEVTVQPAGPVLKVFGDCALIGGRFCSEYTARVGDTVDIKGSVDLGAPEQVIWVRVNWGDGTSDSSNYGFGASSSDRAVAFESLAPLSLVFTASHVYKTAGVYDVVVEVMDIQNRKKFVRLTEAIAP